VTTGREDYHSNYDQFACTILHEVSESLRNLNPTQELGYFDGFFAHGEWGLAANELVAAMLKRKLKLDRPDRLKLVRLYESFRPEEPSNFRDILKLREKLGV
jgi:hypothetical protein